MTKCVKNERIQHVAKIENKQKKGKRVFCFE